VEDVYAHLRAVAGTYFRGRAANHTLQPTALVHEAWLRMAKSDSAPTDREHFMAVAARAMRQILVDHARRRGAQKRGGDRERISLTGLPGDAPGELDVLAVDAALTELAQLNERQARIVELRFFGGLTVPETADALDVSVATVEKDWRRARAWLYGKLES